MKALLTFSLSTNKLCDLIDRFLTYMAHEAGVKPTLLGSDHCVYQLHHSCRSPTKAVVGHCCARRNAEALPPGRSRKMVNAEPFFALSSAFFN